MNDLKLFYLASCPYCKMALKYLDELKAEDAKYADININCIEERKEADLANSYDYYYVPCFFSDDEKLHEGAINKEEVKGLLDSAILAAAK